jgi:hypothetical protein
MRKKLFTKTIDTQLFKQYPYGSDLEKQKVVAKIFNPYGRGRWYILNSDPNDPDYLWAIVEMGDEIEIGSVSREDLETIVVPPFRLNLERDLYFTPINAKEVYEGLRKGQFFAKGGATDVQMVENENNEYFITSSDAKPNSMAVKLANGGTIEDKVEFLNKKVVRYHTVGGGSGTFVVDYATVTPDFYSKREVHLHTKSGSRDSFPLSKLDKFLSGQEIQLKDSKGEAYSIELVDAMRREPVVVRTQFEEEEFEYGNGGKTYYHKDVVAFYNDGEDEEVFYYKNGKLYEKKEGDVDSFELGSFDTMQEASIWLKKESIEKGWRDNLTFKNPYADGGYMENGGEVRRFDRHEQMDSETRGEILDTINEFYLIDGFRNLQNYLYGLFDGYDYSQTYRFKESMEELKEKHENLYIRIKRIYSKIDGYSFTKMAQGGRTKSGLMRDRAYKSEQPFEQAYKRVGRPKNPKYKYGNGGGVYSSDEAYKVEVYSDSKLVEEKTIRARNQREANEMAEDMEDTFKKKHGNDLRIKVTKAMGMGGKTTFKDKQIAIAKSLLKRKKVSPSVQKDYGKTYSKDEAIDSAKRIAGSMAKKKR